MDKWKILGIDKTKDKDVIREGYRRKLTGTNPEDDQEGFMRLRKAYEEALTEADQVEVEADRDDSPVGRWMRDVEETYQCFSKRLNVEIWKRLFWDDVCIALDSKPEAMDTLLRFLMEHFHLPREIWELICDTFDIEEDKEELYESYPRDFIDYMIRNSKFEDVLSYKLYGEIEDGKDYDGFIDCFHQINQNNQNREGEKVKEGLREIGEYGVRHPYVTVEWAKYHLLMNEVEQARTKMKELLRDYPKDETILHVMAEVEWSAKDYEKALKYYEKVLEVVPEHYYAKTGVADCYGQIGKLSEARKIYMDLLDVNRFDGYILSNLMAVNEKKIAYYKENPKEWENSLKNRLEFAWCYFQKEKYTECLEVLDFPEPNDANALEYLYLKGRACLFIKKEDACKEHFQHWLALYQQYEEDEGEVAVKNKKKIGIVYASLCEMKAKEGNLDQALTLIETAIATNDENTAAYYNQKANLLKESGRREEAYTAVTHALGLDKRYYEAYLFRGEMYQEDDRFQEAVDDYDKAIFIYPYYERPYIKELEIFYESNAIEQMKGLLERAEELQVEGNGIRLYQSKLMRREGRFQDAISFMEDLLQSLEEEEDAQKYYQETALAYYDDEQYEKALPYIKKAIQIKPDHPFYHNLEGDILYKCKRYKEAVSSFKKALALSPDNEDVHYRLAFVYRDWERFDEAVRSLKQVIAIHPTHRGAYGVLGEIYEGRREYEEAKYHYGKQLEINPSDYYAICMGLLYYMEGEFDEALQYYEKAKEYGADNPYPYFNEGRVYLAQRRNELALKSLQKAVAMSGESCPEIFYRYLYRCYRRLEDWEKAMHCCDLQIGNKVRVEDAMIRKIWVLKILNRYPDAMKLLEDMGKMEGADMVGVYHEKALVYEEGFQQMAKAEKHYRLAVRTNEDSGKAFRELADFYFRHKSYRKAWKNYKQALQLGDVEEERIYLNMARCCLKMFGRSQKAKEYIKKSLDICKENLYDKCETTRIYCTMIRNYLVTGNVKDAKRLCEEVLSGRCCLCDFCNYRDCHEAYYLRGCLYEWEGEEALALPLYHKAYELSPNDWEYKEAVERLSD